MRKIGSMFVCVIMVLGVLVALTGCGSSEQDKLVGSWEATVDLTEFVNRGLAEEEMPDYTQISDFSLVLRLTFNKDGTYRMFVDEDAAQTSAEKLQQDLADGMTQYFEDIIAQFSAEFGVEMSLDELLEDASMNELIEEVLGNALDSIVSEMDKEGNFAVKDGKLYLSDGLKAGIDEELYQTYEISDDELKILEGFGTDEEDTGINIYPIIFKKVA